MSAYFLMNIAGITFMSLRFSDFLHRINTKETGVS